MRFYEIGERIRRDGEKPIPMRDRWRLPAANNGCYGVNLALRAREGRIRRLAAGAAAVGV